MTSTGTADVAAVVQSGGRHRAPRKMLQTLAGWAAAALIALVVASVSGLLPLQLIRVQSDSMAPTMDTGDLVVLRHAQDRVSRGDVVAVRSPTGDEVLVKRAVGIGGDEISIEDGVLVVDGVPVCETTDPELLDGVWIGPVSVPPGELFLLGDHRDGSIDSRAFGTVSTDRLVGFVETRVWPAPGRLPSIGC